MSNLIECIVEYESTYSLDDLARKTRLEYGFLWSLKNNKYSKYRVKYIDRLYTFFDLEADTWYYNNRKLWNKKTYSEIGNILRLWRIRRGLSIDDVASILKGDKRSISRIEHGDSLPSSNSYYISEMLKLYDFTEEEEIKIKYGIALLQDLLKIMKKYEEIVD